ncbi:MAG: helix-turn-helix domain-containing protein [Candidatus Hodarchaeales archaeon]|jgi:predicted transcriptional regulator
MGEIGSRTEILQEVESSFHEANYRITRIPRSSTVDLVAKAEDSPHIDSNPVLTKVLRSLDNFKMCQSKEMHLLANLIGATPLLIAQYYKKRKILQNEIVYNRHDIKAINLNTLRKLLLHHISPHKVAVRGNKYSIRVNIEKLANFLHQSGKTQIQLSQEIEISRQSLLNYQKGKSLPSEENFQRIVDFLDKTLQISSTNDLIKPYPMFKTGRQQDINFDEISLQEKVQCPKGLKAEVDEHLEELEFRRYWFQKLPWDGFSHEESVRKNKNRLILFTGVGSHPRGIKLSKRIHTTKLVMNLLNQKGIWIIQDNETKDDLFSQVPNLDSGALRILSIDEFQQIKNKKELHKDKKPN